MGACRSNKLSDDSGTIRRCRQTHRTCRREAANGFPQSRCKSSHKEEAPRKQVKSLNMSYLRELIEYKIIGTCDQTSCNRVLARFLLVKTLTESLNVLCCPFRAVTQTRITHAARKVSQNRRTSSSGL